MDEFKLGDNVTINGPSVDGRIISVCKNLHSVPRYCVRRYTHPDGRMVEDWYYGPDLTIKPAEENAG